MASLCAAILKQKKLVCLRSTSSLYCTESQIPIIGNKNNPKSQENREKVICKMMSICTWTTRLQNFIRNIVTSFNDELIYNVLHNAKNSQHALNFFIWAF